jgi:hypothetical protein
MGILFWKSRMFSFFRLKTHRLRKQPRSLTESRASAPECSLKSGVFKRAALFVEKIVCIQQTARKSNKAVYLPVDLIDQFVR